MPLSLESAFIQCILQNHGTLSLQRHSEVLLREPGKNLEMLAFRTMEQIC